MYENDEDWEFQFHKGTIKTTCKYLCGNVSTNFNSIKVQLKREQSPAIKLQE